MVLIIERDGSHRILPDSHESVADMIAHWLDSGRRDIDDEDEEEETDDAGTLMSRGGNGNHIDT